MERTYFFVRHAQAVYQARGFRANAHPPETDWPLTDLGEKQAYAAARALIANGSERVVSSALVRARQTAQIVAEAGRLPYEHSWSELNEIAPRRLRLVPRRRPSVWDALLGVVHLRRHLRGARDLPLDVAGVELRIREVLARLDAFSEQRIGVVGHGYWILMLALVVPGRFRVRWIDNCSITRIASDGLGGYRLLDFAEPIAFA